MEFEDRTCPIPLSEGRSAVKRSMASNQKNLPLLQKYTDSQHESLYRMLCAILRNLDLQAPERSQYDQATLEYLHNLTNNDWLLLGRMAEAERVAPLIYWAVKGSLTLRKAFHPDTYAFLQTSYYAAAAHNAVIIQALERIQKILTEADIPVIVLKGAALAQTVYPDIGLRPMNDLDILVPTEYLEHTLNLLSASGYQKMDYSYNEKLENQLAHAVVLISEDKPGTKVEIHWQLASGVASLFQPQMDWFWQNTETWHLGSIHLGILSTTANLLYLCAHLGQQHGIGKGNLLWFVDIFQLIKQEEDKIDWEEFIQKIGIFGWSASAYYVFIAIYEYFDLSFSDEVFAKLKSQMRPAEETLVLAKSVSVPTSTYDGFVSLLGLGFSMQIKKILVVLFPRPKFMFHRYKICSKWALPLYYPYRWWDMTLKLITELRVKRTTNFRP